MQRHLPLGSLGLQLPDVIWSHPDEPPEVALADDILSEEAAGFPRAQPLSVGRTAVGCAAPSLSC